jgi:peptide/nickel transport system substrate-binding protein
MNRRHLGLITVSLLTASLILASCGSGTSTKTTTSATTKPPTTTTTKTPTTTSSNLPKYGGTLSIARTGDILGFDEGFQAVFFTVTNHLTHDEPMTGDWAKGPGGTNEYSWLSNGNYSWASKGPSVAESYEIPEPGKIVLHIRQGIHFALNPNSPASLLVNGREMTGEDVEWTMNRMRTMKTSYWVTGSPSFVAGLKIKLVDKWTVEATCNVADAYSFAAYLVDWCSILPREVVEKYGDVREWKNSVGTGPFYLTDFVSNSSASFEKNKNYWRTDPVAPGKGNKLPYVDRIKLLIIVDTSTLHSAMRTGKLDILQAQTWDDAKNVRGSIKGLNELDYIYQNPQQLFMRTDKQDLPYKDIKVRKALMYATDYDSIINDFMDGKAYAQSFPITPMPDFKTVYVPLEDLSADIQDLYKYNPDKAKALLKEAGYPDGFQCSVMYSSQGTFNVDYLSILKEMWAKVGVNLSLVPLEFATHNNRWSQRNYDDMFFGLMASAGTYRRGTNFVGVGVGYNLSYINDPALDDAKNRMQARFNAGDDAGCDAIMREITPSIVGNAYVIATPVQYQVNFWQPWIKGYHGESSPGIINEWQENMYLWIDQDLKKSMGY